MKKINIMHGSIMITAMFLALFFEGKAQNHPFETTIFGPPVITNGVNLFCVATGDLNGDGATDIVCAGNDKISVFRNKNLGSIDLFAPIILNSIQGIKKIFITDVDNDGRADIIAWGASPGAALVVYKNISSSSSQLTFSTANYVSLNYPSSSGVIVYDLACVDLNNDGKADLIASFGFLENGVTKGGVGILLDQSTTTLISFSQLLGMQWTSSSSSVPNCRPVAIATGDLDGDNRIDVVVSDNASNMLRVFLNTTNTANQLYFNEKDVTLPNTTPLVIGSYGIAIESLDGKADPEIIVANGTRSSVLNYNNSGTPTVTPAGNFVFGLNTNPSASNIITDDIDGDGKSDLIIGTTAQTLMLIRNNSSNINGGPVMILSPPAFLHIEPTGYSSSSGLIAFADIDNDGKKDIVVAEGNAFVVFKNKSK